MQDAFWGLTSTGWVALGSIAGAATIIVLVVFNVLNLRDTREIAEAAITQAKSAQMTLKELRSEIYLRQVAQRETALSALAEAEGNARNWNAGETVFREYKDKAVLLPPSWANVTIYVAQRVPSMMQQIVSLQNQIAETEELLNAIVRLPESQRSSLRGNQMARLRNGLDNVARDANEAMEKLRKSDGS